MEILKTFTNTDSEDFEGMFHGEVYAIKAGESKVFSEKLAKHLAEQLAYKLAVREGIQNYPQQKLDDLAVSFVGNVDIPPTPAKEESVIADIAEKPKEEEFADIKPKRRKKK